MDPLSPAAPHAYPSFCDTCHGRYQCVCAILADLGLCPICRKFGCACDACKKCESQPCVCGFLISNGHCPTCLWLDCKEHPIKPKNVCTHCESPYDCVCELLIECGNCPNCLKYADHCICGTGPIEREEAELLPCGCYLQCDCKRT